MTWPRAHIELVAAVLDARDALRRLLPELDQNHREHVGNALMRLNRGLKARAQATREPQRAAARRETRISN